MRCQPEKEKQKERKTKIVCTVGVNKMYVEFF